MFKSTRTALIGTSIFILGLDINAAAMGNPCIAVCALSIPQRWWMEVIATVIALIGLVPTLWGGLSYVDKKWPTDPKDKSWS